jgi:arylsulfatase A
MKLLSVLLALVALAAQAADSQKPNIVFILCDDLGYGDVRCLNPQRGKIATPHADRLASQGMIFTDAHSSSAVCTPTRYGIMTGRYNWRTRLQAGVLGGFSPALIAADRLTVPKFLKQHGYTTAAIGKWHLGMTMPARQGVKFTDAIQPGGADQLHAEQRIADGPTTRGFDYYFGISASLDMPPFVFIENDRFTEAPTATKQWLRKGPAGPSFEAVDVLPALTRKAVEFIGKTKSPFFLYLPLASPHTPIGDFVMQTDAALGEIMAALDKAGIADNTLLIFTSDNGCSPAAGTAELENKGHFASGNRRGYKADIYDGGHRIPFLARWPVKVKAGATTDQLVCLADLMATCADILGAKLPDNAGEDSVSILPALRGESYPRAVVHHSINGSFAIREGRWKLELCRGSGGWSKGDDTDPIQLYDMSKDVGERANAYKEHPEVVERLTKLLEKYVADGRSTPGAPQSNDVAVEIHKQAKGKGRKK